MRADERAQRPPSRTLLQEAANRAIFAWAASLDEADQDVSAFDAKTSRLYHAAHALRAAHRPAEPEPMYRVSWTENGEFRVGDFPASELPYKFTLIDPPRHVHPLNADGMALAELGSAEEIARLTTLDGSLPTPGEAEYRVLWKTEYKRDFRIFYASEMPELFSDGRRPEYVHPMVDGRAEAQLSGAEVDQLIASPE